MKIFSSLFLLIITACSTTKPLEHQAQVSIDENLLLQIQKEKSWGRAPASVNLVEEKISPKRVYFRTLFGQFLTFQKLAGTQVMLASCPAFHQDFIATKPTELEAMTRISASDRMHETEQEVRELCDKGASSNYYKFENLVTYHRDNEKFHLTPKSFFALMKIPVFANMYELKMKSNIQSAPSELTTLSRTQWFSVYLERQKRDDKVISLRN